jgi:hypothetical protein
VISNPIEMKNFREPVFDLLQEDRDSWWGGRLVSIQNPQIFDGLSLKAKKYFELTLLDDHNIGGSQLSEIQIGVSKTKDKLESDEFVEALKQLLKCKEVISIDLVYNLSESGQSFSGCQNAQVFIENCSEILNGADIKRIRLGCDINDNGIELITKSCPNLTHINLPFCYEMTSAGLISIVKNCRALISLNLKNVWLVDSIGIKALSEFSETLTILHMDLHFKGDANQEIANFLSSHPKLTSFSLYYEKLNPIGISPLGECKELVFLRIIKSPIFENLIRPEHLSYVVKKCLKLKYLDLQGRSISTDFLNDIATHLEELEYLDVSNGTQPVREAGVLFIKQKCRRIKVFNEPPLWINLWRNLVGNFNQLNP